MLIIGLAGGSGSGKGLAAIFFEKYNIRSIDTDALYRTMTAPGGRCIPYLKEHFGDSVIDKNGALDRKALASIVFSSFCFRKKISAQ